MNSYGSFSVEFLIFDTTKDEEKQRKRKLFQTELVWGVFATIISACLNHIVTIGENLLFFNWAFFKSQKLNIYHTKLVEKTNHSAKIDQTEAISFFFLLQLHACKLRSNSLSFSHQIKTTYNKKAIEKISWMQSKYIFPKISMFSWERRQRLLPEIDSFYEKYLKTQSCLK